MPLLLHPSGYVQEVSAVGVSSCFKVRSCEIANLPGRYVYAEYIEASAALGKVIRA
jgi:hypothetical protein